MTMGKRTAQLAAAETVTPEERTAIRKGLAPVLERMRHDLSLAAEALGGPDPEYALFLFSEVLAEMPAALRDLESVLLAARAHPMRVAA